MTRSLIGFSLMTALVPTFSTAASGSDTAIHLQSTTSTKNSGFYDYLLPKFKKETGIEVYVIAVGTGQAIRNARNCDGDVLLTHTKADEEKFVTEGYGVKRYRLMYNDYVIVGPSSDPAKISGLKAVSTALKKIAESKSLFASRGDNSGTHKREKSLWKDADISPTASSGTWYRETGAGMGTTLNIAIGMASYTLTDRASWVAFKNKYDFKIHVAEDKSLFNQYGVILVNPQKCPATKAKAGQKFIDWLRSPSGQTTVRNFRKNGQQLFFPNAE